MEKTNKLLTNDYNLFCDLFEKVSEDYNKKFIKFETIEEFGIYLKLDENIKKEYSTY